MRVRASRKVPLYAGAALAVVLAAAGCGLARAADDSSPQGIARWFDPATAPFIPIPDIDHDPNSGTTLGLIPTRLVTDEQSQIRKIIAPDVDLQPVLRRRRRASASMDIRRTIRNGRDRRRESARGKELDYEYQTGRLRNSTVLRRQGRVRPQRHAALLRHRQQLALSTMKPTTRCCRSTRRRRSAGI